MSSVQKKRIIGVARAIHAYKPKTEKEIELTKGQSINILDKYSNGWWLGESGGKIGLFPGSYVKEESAAAASAATVAPTVVVAPGGVVAGSVASSAAAASGQTVVRGDSGARLNPSAKGFCVAMVSKKPAQDGHLELVEGDVISIIDSFSTGWIKGEKGGRTGLCSSKDVRIVSADEAQALLNARAASAASATPVAAAAVVAAAPTAVVRTQDQPLSAAPSMSDASASNSSASEPSSSSSHSDGKKKKTKVLCKVVGLYDREASSPNELSFKKGDIIRITQKPQEQGWWKGTLNGKVGHVPSSWVKLYEEPVAPKVSPRVADPIVVVKEGAVIPIKNLKKARVMYNFVSGGPGELTVNRGDIVTVLEQDTSAGWWKVELNGLLGHVPGQYVQLIEEAPGPAAPVQADPQPAVQQAKPVAVAVAAAVAVVETPQAQPASAGVVVAQAQISPRGQIPVQAAVLVAPTILKGRALYDFKTDRPGELSVLKGEIFTLLEQSSSSGWLKAENNGKVGYVPSQYVQVLNSAPSVAPAVDAKAEAERIQREKEAERIKREQEAAAAAEAERQRQEAERIKREQEAAEAERQRQEAERIRLEQEAAAAEIERKQQEAAAEAERQRQEAERIKREQEAAAEAERQRQETERIRLEQEAAAEAERQRQEAERIQKQQEAEKQRQEAERIKLKQEAAAAAAAAEAERQRQFLFQQQQQQQAERLRALQEQEAEEERQRQYLIQQHQQEILQQQEFDRQQQLALQQQQQEADRLQKQREEEEALELQRQQQELLIQHEQALLLQQQQQLKKAQEEEEQRQKQLQALKDQQKEAEERKQELERIKQSNEDRHKFTAEQEQALKEIDRIAKSKVPTKSPAVVLPPGSSVVPVSSPPRGGSSAVPASSPPRGGSSGTVGRQRPASRPPANRQLPTPPASNPFDDLRNLVLDLQAKVAVSETFEARLSESEQKRMQQELLISQLQRDLYDLRHGSSNPLSFSNPYSNSQPPYSSSPSPFVPNPVPATMNEVRDQLDREMRTRRELESIVHRLETELETTSRRLTKLQRDFDDALKDGQISRDRLRTTGRDLTQ